MYHRLLWFYPHPSTFSPCNPTRQTCSYKCTPAPPSLFHCGVLHHQHFKNGRMIFIAIQSDVPESLTDYGPNAFVFNIEDAAMSNTAFRTAIWTGNNLQMTLMSIPVGGEIGLESHPNLDQFIRLESGCGTVFIGDAKDQFTVNQPVCKNSAFFIPAGKWHNLINTGKAPIKLYSIYAPPQHPRGTVHLTKEDADKAEGAT